MDVQDHYSPEYDEGEALWVEVEGFEGVERYYVDETFEIEWLNTTYTYAVLVREEDFPNYAQGIINFVPDLMRYSEDSCALEEILDEDEKAFVVDSINEFYTGSNSQA